MKVLSKVREYRNRKGWTQRQLASEVGTSQAQVQCWEKGRIANKVMMTRLTSVFQCTPNDLYPTI